MDEVLLGKAAIIERCLRRIDEEYRGHEADLATNFTRQDSILLNLQRVCEASIDAPCAGRFAVRRTEGRLPRPA